MKKRILYNPLTDEFATLGDKFEKIAHNKVNGMYCYKRTTSDGLTYYEVFRENQSNLQGLEIYVDAGDITLKGKEYVCLVGDTKATIEASRPQFTHTIILMHGARAQINAKDYAVLNIVNISGEYSVNKDGTVIVL